MIGRYRKRPVVIEAVQIVSAMFTGEHPNPLHFSTPDIEYHTAQQGGEPENVVKIKTLEGLMTGQVGDWIIKDVNGEFYPCKPDIFTKSYEPVEGD